MMESFDLWLIAGTSTAKPAKINGPGCRRGRITINGGDREAHWNATIYAGAKRDLVFNASTIYWAQGLSSPPGHMLPYSRYGRPHGPDVRVHRMTRNLFERFLK